MRTPRHMNRILGTGFALLLLLTTDLAAAEPPLEPPIEPVSESVSEAPPPPATTQLITPRPDPALPDARTAAAAAPMPQTSRAHLALTAFGGFGLELTERPQIPFLGSVSQSIGSGGLILESDVYFRPLVEDDSPRLLQPFLQRASTFSLYAGGKSTRSTYYVNGRESGHDQVSRGFAGVDLAVYAARSFRVSGSLGFSVAGGSFGSGLGTSSSPAFFAIPVDVGLGTRLGDTLIEVTYGLQAMNDAKGHWDIPFWGGAGVSLRSVILRRHDLSLGVRGLSEGAAMGVRFASYPTQAFGGWIALNYRHQKYTKSLGGEIGISYFRWRRFGGQLSFLPTWSTSSSSGETASYFDGVFSLTLFSRT